MRLGVSWFPGNAANYRAIGPMAEMERRGHEVVWPQSPQGDASVSHLAGCDAVHVYRSFDADARARIEQLARLGVGVTWDNDDDFRNLPEDGPTFAKWSRREAHRLFDETVATARLAHGVTVTTEALREVYASVGIDGVEVIDNMVRPDLARPETRHDGVVIGWIAGDEHMVDVAHIPIRDALERVVAAHPEVRVECIGVDLRLPERYRHDRNVPFAELPARMGAWDVGIAPLADLPFNRTRSSIKLKEYAASGLAWLASPIGPYLGLGEDQGGRLVPDDAWHDALDRLVTHARDRKRLARKARKWAKRQTTEAAGDRWERVFADAAAAARRTRAAA